PLGYAYGCRWMRARVGSCSSRRIAPDALFGMPGRVDSRAGLEEQRQRPESPLNISVFAHFSIDRRRRKGALRPPFAHAGRLLRAYLLLVWATNSGSFWVLRSKARK